MEPILVQLDDYVPLRPTATSTTICFVALTPAQCCQSFVRSALWARPLLSRSGVEEDLAFTEALYFPAEEDPAMLYCPALDPCVAAFAHDQAELIVQTAAKYGHESLVIWPEEWPVFLASTFRDVFMGELSGVISSCVFAMGPLQLQHPQSAGSRFRRAFEQEDDDMELDRISAEEM